MFRGLSTVTHLNSDLDVATHRSTDRPGHAEFRVGDDQHEPDLMNVFLAPRLGVVAARPVTAAKTL